METLEIKDFIKFFLKNIILFLFILLSCVACGIIYLKCSYTPKYQSTTTVLVLDIYDTNKDYLSRNLTNSCKHIIKGSNVLTNVINNLELDYDITYLYNNITVESINDAELIKISFTDKDAEVASSIVSELANEFIINMQNIYGYENLQVIDEAHLIPISQNKLFLTELLKYTFLGCIFGMIIIVIRYYLDNSVKNIYDIKKLGYNVIGTIRKKQEDIDMVTSIVKNKIGDNKKILILDKGLDEDIYQMLSHVNDKVVIFDFDGNLKDINCKCKIISFDDSINTEKIKELIDKESKNYDIVLCKTSKLALSLNLLSITGSVIILSKLYKTSIVDLEKIANSFIQFNINNLDIIIEEN